ncbi:hypothetical protein PCANC_08862 [Puccinia coronata f. sp. avenae]|uniref:Uncharacterized protein n=1 Tax=Puccinia coronata f. sp. avenae TaxID=200324 RepID=A0A2N5SYY5_9BASI|nr:hypothetical protein PCANC_08862 [Puccinia coronata f. sp. avenae]
MKRKRQQSPPASREVPEVINVDYQSGSTKNFHEHLLKVHRLVDPKLTDKIDKSQTNLAKWTKTSQLAPKVLLNSDTLKTAIAYFIAKADLPFSVVERH